MKKIISMLLLAVMLSSALEAFATMSYSDITNEHWAAEYIKQLTDKGIVFGTPEGKILPDNNITRAEISAMISRTYDEEYVGSTQSFNDVQGHWAKNDIERLVQNGIIIKDEYGDKYSPDTYVTRIEMILYVLRWLKLSEQTVIQNIDTPYVDNYMISESDRGYINVAREYGIISGYPDNSVRPYGKITRGEVFKIFCVALDIKDVGPTPTPTVLPTPTVTPKVLHSGGGSSSNKPATVEFTVPNTVYTDTLIEFETINQYVKSMEWALKKYSDETQEYVLVPIDEYIDGTINDKGGSFKFKTAGQYQLCASAFNSKGKKYEYSKDITVSEISTVNIDLPQYTHTDTEINVTVNSDKKSFKWNVILDGQEVTDLSECIDGSLDNDKNTIKLKKSGRYTFECEVTDETGRTFGDSKSIVVYPVPELMFETPEVVYTDSKFPVIVATDLSGYDVNWLISKDNGDSKIYTEYTDFVLNEYGGDIQLLNSGEYTLTLSAVDTTGRKFEYSRNIKVIPVANFTFTMPSVAHTDTDINIVSEIINADKVEVQWTISKDGMEKAYTEYADGNLTSDGGSICFKTDGEYTVYARFKDNAGRTYETSQTIKIYKVPVVDYINNPLPSYSYTDNDIEVKPDIKNIDGLNIDWYINNKSYAEYVSGKLDNNGGKIRFKQQGHYIVTASITDETGRIFKYDVQLDIYPVLYIGIEIPSYSHTDTNVQVNVNTEEVNDKTIDWSISKDDGKFAEIAEVADGILDNTGGTLLFKDKGSYKLKATVTDNFGRKFEYVTEPIKIYTIPTVEFSTNSNAEYPLPSYGYINKNITVIPAVSEIGNLKIQWQISKDGKSEKDYTAYVTGTLTNDGGNITFPNIGDYTLIAKVTDETGRVFMYSEDIMINDMPNADFDISEYRYTGSDINISFSGEEYTAEWTISKDNGKAEKYSEYATGPLTNKGGIITFNDKGIYKVILTVKDKSGKTYSCTKKIKIIAPPKMNITVAKYGYTDSEITIQSENVNMTNLNTIWYINDKPYQSYAVGTLSNTGGTVKFRTSGTYSLKASVIDDYGKEYIFTSNNFEIYPILNPNFEIPQYTYVGDDVHISNVSGENIVWKINDEDYITYATGRLTDNGGSIRFNESGEYIVSASVTDVRGRTFKVERSISVYNNAKLELSANKNDVYTSETVTLVADTENISNISWYISKDDDDKQNYLKYASGVLNNSGGEIIFSENGIYTVYANGDNKYGKKYNKEVTITVIDKPILEFSIDKESAYVQTTVRVSSKLSNIEDCKIDWYIEKNGLRNPYNDYVNGTLSNYGGNIYFNQGGEYILYAVLTDRNGNEEEKSCKITIYDRVAISINIAEVGYVGIANKVIATVSNDEWEKIQWYISVNGGARKNYLECADGTLTNDGGQLTFNSTGIYTLYAVLTDKAGNTVETNESITVYTVPTADIIAPSITHTDTPITVTAAFENSDNDVTWCITKDGGEEKLYINYCTGSLRKAGGQISFKTSGTYRLIASTTDNAGQIHKFSTDIRVYPKPNLTTSLSRRMHLNSQYSSSYTIEKWGNQSIEWKLEKEGTPINMDDYGAFDFSNGNITARFFSEGNYELIAYIEDETEKVFRCAVPIEVYNTPPYISGVLVNNTRQYKDGKYLVTLTPSAIDSDGDFISGYEYINKPSDNYYPVGKIYVKVRAKDIYGKYSEWYDVVVNVSNSAPNAPTISRTPDTISVTPGTKVIMKESATDPDGDTVSYEWEGLREDGIYPLGKNIVRCKAVDTAGLKSAATAVVFFVADETNGGGMELVDAESRIVEEGIDGATISSYEFNVPSVDGHNGNDYGQVQGFNVNTGEWELIEKRSVSNGITMTGTLEKGKYSKLEFFYNASHCMYGKSNITYNVEFYFPAE